MNKKMNLVPKLKPIAKLKKELDRLWSKRMRERDGKCVLCGAKDKQLYAHHFIVNRARSVKYRYDIRNGVALCYACHRFKVHKTAAFEYAGAIADYAIANEILTLEELKEIATDKNNKEHTSRGSLSPRDLGKDRGVLEAVRIEPEERE
jgi:predicted restriction endonuclease